MYSQKYCNYNNWGINSKTSFIKCLNLKTSFIIRLKECVSDICVGLYDRHMYERIQKVTREKYDIENERVSMRDTFFPHLQLHLIARVVKEVKECENIIAYL